MNWPKCSSRYKSGARSEGGGAGIAIRASFDPILVLPSTTDSSFPIYGNSRNASDAWEETTASHPFLLVEMFDILRDIVYRVWPNDMRAERAHATNWNVGFALELFHCRDSHFEGACLTRSVILLLACIYYFLSLPLLLHLYARVHVYIRLCCVGRMYEISEYLMNE